MQKLFTSLLIVGGLQSASSKQLEQTCSDRQKVLPDGTCQDCPDYLRAQNNGRICAPDRCDRDQILLINGTCETCGPFTSPDRVRKSCISYVQNGSQSPPPQVNPSPPPRPAPSPRSSLPRFNQDIVEPLSSEQQIHESQEPQNRFETRPQLPTTTSTPTRNTSFCNDRQIQGQGGVCHMCPSYTKPQNEGSHCAPNDCAHNQIVKVDGTCQNCPNWHESSADGRTCEAQIICFTGYIATPEGKCVLPEKKENQEPNILMSEEGVDELKNEIQVLFNENSAQEEKVLARDFHLNQPNFEDQTDKAIKDLTNIVTGQYARDGNDIGSWVTVLNHLIEKQIQDRVEQQVQLRVEQEVQQRLDQEVLKKVHEVLEQQKSADSGEHMSCQRWVQVKQVKKLGNQIRQTSSASSDPMVDNTDMVHDNQKEETRRTTIKERLNKYEGRQHLLQIEEQRPQLGEQQDRERTQRIQTNILVHTANLDRESIIPNLDNDIKLSDLSLDP